MLDRCLVPSESIYIGCLPCRGLKRSLPNAEDLEIYIRFALRGDRSRVKATYLKEMPYCETASYPDFQTSVTSQAFVAWSLQDRNAETAFPPTEQILISNGSSIVVYYISRVCGSASNAWVGRRR